MAGAAAIALVGAPLLGVTPASAAVSPSQQFVTAVSAPSNDGTGVGASRTITFGSTGVTALESTTAVSGQKCSMSGSSAFGGTNITSFISPTPPADAIAAGTGCYGDPNGGPKGSRVSTLTFNKPVVAPVIHLVNLDSSYVEISGTSTTGAPITTQRVSGNNALEQSGNRWNSVLEPARQTGCQANDGTNPNGACGSVRISAASGAIEQITLLNSTVGSTLTSGFNDGWSWTMSFPTAPLTKAFSPANVVTGGTGQLTFTIQNPTAEAQPTLTPLSFADALPAGLTIANGTFTATGCGDPAVTGPGGAALAAGTTSVNVANATVPAGSSCQVTVSVTSNTPGAYRNTTANLTSGVGNLVPNADTTIAFVTPSITVAKTAGTPADVNSNGLVDAGDTIPYSFLVTNTGDVALSNVTVNDPLIAGVQCPASTLAAGASFTCTATYTITAADQSAGSVVNTATVTGTPPGLLPVTSPPSTTTTTVTAPVPALTLVKTATPGDAGSFIVGQEIEYSFTATNPGNVTLTDVTVTEGTFTGSGDLGPITPDPVTLAPGATQTFTASYTLTQADVDAGSVQNSAIVSGNPPTGPPIEAPPSEVEIPFLAEPSLTIEKSSDIAEITEAGQVITYSFLVTNTGNVTITGAAPVETEFSGSGALGPITPGPVTLVPGQNTTFTAEYTVTQADVEAGGVTNAATADGTPPAGAGELPPVLPSEVTVPSTPVPSLTVVKSADSVDAESYEAGQVLTYSFLVTNTGNVTITDVAPVEGDFTGSGELGEIAPGPVTLAPGAEQVFTAQYTLTQADVDAGSVENTATAAGVPPTGSPVEAPSSQVVVPSTPAPALTLAKSADIERVTTVGQIVTYSFLVTNTGNVTLTDVAPVEGDFSGAGELGQITPASVTLAPGERATFTAEYTVVRADLDAPGLTNTATGTGTPPGGSVIASPPSTVEVPVTQALPAQALPVTGAEVAPMLLIGLLTLLAGAVVLVVRRRGSMG